MESVWDYPRPPRVEPSARRIKVIFNEIVLAETDRAMRVLETSHPPVYYIPPDDVRMEHLLVTARKSICEWKGIASYYTIIVGDKKAENAAWFYPQPPASFESIRNYIAFYPSKMDACYVGDELATPQPGGFYGGWITSEIDMEG